MSTEEFREKSDWLRGLYKAGRITHAEYEKWIFSEDPEFTPEILPEEVVINPITQIPATPTESYRMDILDFSKTLGEEEPKKSEGKGLFEQIREEEPMVLRRGVTAEGLRELVEEIFYRKVKTK